MATQSNKDVFTLLLKLQKKKKQQLKTLIFCDVVCVGTRGSWRDPRDSRYDHDYDERGRFEGGFQRDRQSNYDRDRPFGKGRGSWEDEGDAGTSIIYIDLSNFLEVHVLIT